MGYKSEIENLIPKKSKEEKYIDELAAAIAGTVDRYIRYRAENWESQENFNCTFFVSLSPIIHDDNKWINRSITEIKRIFSKKIKKRQYTFSINNNYIEKITDKLKLLLRSEDGFKLHDLELICFDHYNEGRHGHCLSNYLFYYIIDESDPFLVLSDKINVYQPFKCEISNDTFERDVFYQENPKHFYRIPVGYGSSDLAVALKITFKL